jgi:protein involved in polysaccharide export with SLBB domain
MNTGPAIFEVDGRVLRPGPIRHTGGMTAGDALLAAGGAERFGRIRQVHLYRNGHKVASST